jgi:ferritin-like metal-binding protein YciE
MPESKSLHDMFIDELRDAYDAEKQLTKALPKLARAAKSEELRAAFDEHLTETQGHVTRLEEVFATLEEKPRGKHCDGIAGIIEEGKSLLEEDVDESALDACLIAAGQRAEHYEMAAYGSLIAWARAMEHNEAADLLEQNLEEEKAADEKLTALAEGGINEEAASAARDGEDGDEDDEDKPPSSRRKAMSASGGRSKSAKKVARRR